MGLEIELLDTASAPESVLRDLAAYYVIINREERPTDPPTPVAKEIADWRNPPAHQPTPRWVLRDRGEIVAAAVAAYDVDQNPENGFGRIHVHPDHRGQGHARRLAGPLLDHLEDQGRRRFETSIQVGDPAEALAERLGLSRAMTERRSRLAIADLDQDLMRAWIEQATDRAAEYDLIYHLSPMPEEDLAGFCDLTDVMNTAPREDYEMDDEVLTPTMWRDIEEKIRDAQSQLHTLVAVHRPSGEFAGFTVLRTQDLQPDLAWQWDTGVHPEHRNRGLGRWLKAEMIERIVAAYPQLERVDTYNAGSNRPMLDINIAMGFRSIYEESIWQGDLGKVRAGLGV
jgi:mycothiol synthase